MSLPSTGSISTSQVNTELTRPAQQFIKFSDNSVRLLFQKTTGSVNLGSGRGKSRDNVLQTVAFGDPNPRYYAGAGGGGNFSWTVPALINTVRISAAGGGGGCAAGWGFLGGRSQGAAIGGPGGFIRNLVISVVPGDVISGSWGNGGGTGGWAGSYGIFYGGSGSNTDIYKNGSLIARCFAGGNAYTTNGALSGIVGGEASSAQIFSGSGEVLTGTKGGVFGGYDGGPGYCPWGFYYAINIAGSYPNYYQNNPGSVPIQTPIQLAGSVSSTWTSVWRNIGGLGQVPGWVAIQYPGVL